MARNTRTWLIFVFVVSGILWFAGTALADTETFNNVWIDWGGHNEHGPFDVEAGTVFSADLVPTDTDMRLYLTVQWNAPASQNDYDCWASADSWGSTAVHAICDDDQGSPALGLAPAVVPEGVTQAYVSVDATPATTGDYDLNVSWTEPTSGCRYRDATIGTDVAGGGTFNYPGIYHIAAWAGSNGTEEAPPAELGDLDTVIKLAPESYIYGGRAGFGVAMDDNEVVVGAMGHLYSGEAYLYSAHSGELLETLKPNNFHDHQGFGYDVDMDENYIVVGAIADDGNTLDGGAIYVFDRLTLNQVCVFNYPGTYKDARLGDSVAIDNGTIVAGAKYDQHNCGSGPSVASTYKTNGLETCSGSLYAAKGNAYIIDADDCTLIADLGILMDLEDDLESGSYRNNDGTGTWFGEWVDIDCDYAVVGAHRTDEAQPSNVNCDSGSAYVFKKDASGTWSYQRKLVAPYDGTNRCEDRFGVRLALDGEIVAVSADSWNSKGKVYLFNVATGVLQTSISRSLDPGARFGFGVELKGANLMIGASGDRSGEGALYQYDVGTNPYNPALVDSWYQSIDPRIQLNASDAGFGSNVRMSPDGQKAIAGAWYDTMGGQTLAGSAFLLK